MKSLLKLVLFTLSISFTFSLPSFADEAKDVNLCNSKFLTETLTGKLSQNLVNSFTKFPFNCFRDGKEMTLLISSPGGSTSAAAGFYDIVEFHGDRKKFTTIAAGSVSSSAVIVFLSGGKRFMLPNSRLFLHDVSTPNPDSDHFAEVIDIHNILKNERARMVEITVKASGGKITPEEVDQFMTESTYLTPDQAVKHGLAHGVINNVEDLK